MSMIAFDRWVGGSLEVSRAVIEAAFRDEFLNLSPESVVPELRSRGGAVVSLVKRGQIRGSAGTFWGFHRFMGAEVAWATVQAAFNDRRFEPLEEWELEEVEVVVDLVYDQRPGGLLDIGAGSTCLVDLGERQLLVTPPPGATPSGWEIGESRDGRPSKATVGEDRERASFGGPAPERLLAEASRAAAAGDWDAVRRLLDAATDTGAAPRVWVAPLRRARAKFGDIRAVSLDPGDRGEEPQPSCPDADPSPAKAEPSGPKERPSGPKAQPSGPKAQPSGPKERRL